MVIQVKHCETISEKFRLAPKHNWHLIAFSYPILGADMQMK